MLPLFTPTNWKMYDSAIPLLYKTVTRESVGFIGIANFEVKQDEIIVISNLNNKEQFKN